MCSLESLWWPDILISYSLNTAISMICFLTFVVYDIGNHYVKVPCRLYIACKIDLHRYPFFKYKAENYLGSVKNSPSARATGSQ